MTCIWSGGSLVYLLGWALVQGGRTAALVLALWAALRWIPWAALAVAAAVLAAGLLAVFPVAFSHGAAITDLRGFFSAEFLRAAVLTSVLLLPRLLGRQDPLWAPACSW